VITAHDPEVWQAQRRSGLIEVKCSAVLILDHANAAQADDNGPERILRPPALQPPLIRERLHKPRLDRLDESRDVLRVPEDTGLKVGIPEQRVQV